MFKPVTMPLVFDVARAESAKLERPVSEADLYWPEIESEEAPKLARSREAA